MYLFIALFTFSDICEEIRWHVLKLLGKDKFTKQPKTPPNIWHDHNMRSQ